MKPKLGLVGWKTGDNSFGATLAYLHHLSFFGEVRILTPKKEIDLDLDLIVLPGGKDTLPSKYGAVPGYYNSDPDQFKEAFIDLNLKGYIEAGIPVWGTCLGFQQLMVYFGCKLHQNINLGIHGYSDAEKVGRGELVNDLTFTPKYIPFENELLNKRKGKSKSFKVCSLHHQAVLIDKDETNYGIPDCLDVVAYTDDVVELFRHKELPIAGSQSHVEEDFNMPAMTMIRELISRSPNRKNENKGVKQQSKV